MGRDPAFASHVRRGFPLLLATVHKQQYYPQRPQLSSWRFDSGPGNPVGNGVFFGRSAAKAFWRPRFPPNNLLKGEGPRQPMSCRGWRGFPFSDSVALPAHVACSCWSAKLSHCSAMSSIARARPMGESPCPSRRWRFEPWRSRGSS